MDGRKAGFIAIGVGVAMAAVGTVLVVRSQKNQLAGLGRAGRRKATPQIGREVVRSGGMTLRHHRSRKMPIRERVAVLQDITYKSVQDPEMRKLALQITKKCQARDGDCEARAIYDWIKANVRYTGDVGPHKLGRNGPVEGVDLFQAAGRTVEFGGGDCDDHSILGCTLALHNGLSCRYRVTSQTRRREDDFTHIYAMVGLPKNNPRKLVAIDTTLEGGRFGTEAPHAKRLDFVA